MPAAFVLDQTPLDSPFFALDGDGSQAAQGRDILVEIDAWNLSTGALATFYFGSRAYSSPTAPGFYAPRLEQPLNFRRDIYAGSTTGGASRMSFGEMRLINNDGGLDYLKTGYSISGQRIRMLIGDVRDTYADFEPLIVGRVQQVFFNNADLTIQLRDRMLDLSGEIQANKYAGDNVLPDGLEGVATGDIKDRPKPLLFGIGQNFSPPCVNTSKLIYQANDGPFTGPLTTPFVYDNGALLTFGAEYIDEVDLLTNAPSAGQFRNLESAGYFRLGATPVGTITCTAADIADAAGSLTIAQIAVRIVTHVQPTGEGGVDSLDVNFDDVDALDIAAPMVGGIWFNGGETYAAVLDPIMTSVGAWYGFDRLGMFRMQRLELPVLPYAVTCRVASLANPMALGDFNIIEFRLMPSNDPEKGLPTHKVNVEYGRNYTVQPPSVLAGAVLQVEKDFLGTAVRTASTTSDPLVLEAYPLAVEKTVTTLLFSQAAASGDAATEAARLQSMFREPRDFLEIDLALTSDLIALVDLGSVINVVLPRAPYTTGQIMRVIGMGYNAQAGIVTLALWG